MVLDKAKACDVERMEELMTLPSDSNVDVWYGVSVQLEDTNPWIWCYVEVKASSESEARDKLRRLFRDEVKVNYVEVM